MSRRRAVALAALVVALGCHRPPPLPGPNVVARLAGTEVKSGEFSDYLERNLGESGGGLESEALSGLFDQFVDERLLARLALDRGLVAAPDGAAAAVDRLLAAEPAPPITETALAAYYAEHAAEFGVPERVALRVIRTEDRVSAERARREILAGADFATVARRLSADPTAAAGGDQGELSRDELPGAVAAIVFALPVGQPSNVVPGDDGFRLFLVDRRMPARQRTLDEAREEIRRRLGGARADRTVARLLGEARTRYAVEVFDRNLPFAYKGKFPVARPYENR